YDAKNITAFRRKQRVRLHYLTVDMRPPSFQRDELKSTKLNNAFRLLTKDPEGDGREFYVCCTETMQEKMDWARYFTEAISKWMKRPDCPPHAVDTLQPGWYGHFVRGTRGEVTRGEVMRCEGDATARKLTRRARCTVLQCKLVRR